MSHLNEIIVYLWLVPVCLQICLPLAVLGLKLVTRVPFQLPKKTTNALGETSTTPA